METTIHQTNPRDDNLTFVIYWTRNGRRKFYTGTKLGVYEFSAEVWKAKTYKSWKTARAQKARMHKACGPAFQGTLWVASI